MLAGTRSRAGHLERPSSPSDAWTDRSACRVADQRVRADAPRHVRRGWFQIGPSMFFQVRYGNKPLDLGKGMTAVEISGVDAIPATIDAVIEAVNAGELDEALAAASVEPRANFKRRKASK